MATISKPQVLTSWRALQKEYEENKVHWDGWLFRGQAFPKQDYDSHPSVQTSLERAMKRFSVSLKKAPMVEYKLLRDFKRRCHLVSSCSPASDNKMEWLALYRHFGGPSRLSDWTYGFWIAVFFALERARVDKDICEVWALNARDWQKRAEIRFSRLRHKLREYGSNSSKEAEALFKTKKPGLWTMNSFRLNERLSIQQGAFLVPLDMTKSFMDNLDAAAPKRIHDDQLSIYRIAMNTQNLKESLKELHRMNLNRATLFPGLDGLAMSLENMIAMPHFFYGVNGDLSTGPL